jgi:hypothetical protein
MSEKMTVYFLTHTRHVVGALTRADERGADSVLVAAGTEDVMVRGYGAAPFLVRSAYLSVLVGDPDPAVLLSPRSFQVPLQGTAPQPLPAAVVTQLSLTFTQVVVTVGPPPTTEEEEVWVQIQGGSLVRPLVATGVISQGATTATLPIEALAPGNYEVLALVRGRVPLPQSIQL